MSISNIFKSIYEKNSWGNNESVSGNGSTLFYTKNLREQLPILINEFKINSILDAPCGDFNWMKEVLPNLNVEYTGGDIVEPLVNKLNQNYKNSKTKFCVLDITEDNLPTADLMICRDCLFHLEPALVKKFFKNFISSNIKYLLTTTHINENNEFQNVRKMRTGKFNKIDLFSEPYNLPSNVLFRINDFVPGWPKREMVLFKREDLIKIYE